MKITKEAELQIKEILKIYHNELDKLNNDYKKDVDLAMKKMVKEIENIQNEKDEKIEDDLIEELKNI